MRTIPTAQQQTFSSVKIYAKILAGFLLLLFVFAVVAIINIRQINKNEKYSLETVKSEQMLQQSAVLQKSVIDMQSGLRGYLLTGLRQHLTPFYVASSSLDQKLKAQKNNLRPDSEQIGLFERIQKEIYFYRDSVAYPLIANKAKQLNAGSEEYKFFLNENRLLVDEHDLVVDIRELSQMFDKEEYDRRLQMRSRMYASFAQTKFITFMLLGVAIVIGLITAFSISKNIRQRISSLSYGINKIAMGDYNFKLDENINDELNKLSKAVNSMSVKLYQNFSQLRQKNEELEQFAWVASHDLREPLRMVALYIQKLEHSIEEKLNPDEKENIGFIVDSVSRMNDMIKGLLEYGRISQTEVKKEFYSSGEIISNALQNLQLSIKERNATIEIDPSVPPRIKGVKILLLQLFQNLIQNALKFSVEERKPKIVISARYSDNNWIFSIKDNGIGINKEYQERAFGLFQKIHDKSKYEGTGIGLSLCKKIVDMHGGTIWMESEPGDGTTIFFSLPYENVSTLEVNHAGRLS